MSNSNIINGLKSKFLKDVISNNDIIDAIAPPDRSNENWEAMDMIYTPNNKFTSHLYKYIKTAFTDQVISMMCIEVNSSKSRNSDIYSNVVMEIWIFCHNDFLYISDLPTTSNRVDYIGELIDEMINNKYEAIGKFTLATSKAGSYNEKYYLRKLVFEGVDLNYDLCMEE